MWSRSDTLGFRLSLGGPRSPSSVTFLEKRGWAGLAPLSECAATGSPSLSPSPPNENSAQSTKASPLPEPATAAQAQWEPRKAAPKVTNTDVGDLNEVILLLKEGRGIGAGSVELLWISDSRQRVSCLNRHLSGHQQFPLLRPVASSSNRMPSVFSSGCARLPLAGFVAAA